MSNVRQIVVEKIRLEQEIAVSLKRLFAIHSREFFNKLIGRQRTDFNLLASLSSDLKGHYSKVKKTFLGGISLPASLQLTDDESDNLNRFLDIRFNERAEKQAAIINETTNDNEDQAIIMANIDADERRLQGESLDTIAVAAVAASLLSRKLRSRVESISSFETQVSAEETRKAEVGMLMGNRVDPISSGSRASKIVKEWATVGDEKVRPAHARADGQTVPENEPFIVGGERLMVPGDTSLGASVGNVINCRCSVIYNDESVLAERERLLDVTIIVEGPSSL